MKKKITILGSTGSIGKTLINILKKDINGFEILLLTADKNINELLKQIKIFNVKNIIVTDYNKFLKLKKILKNKKIDYYDFSDLFKENNQLKFWKDSSHLSNLGAEIFTEEIEILLDEYL